ncbi:MAG: hypothetical protein ACI9DC_000295 [Gammaproteobacteria bacterium]|jgi:hypothetical protein
MNFPFRLFVPILGVFALCATPAKAVEFFAQTAQVEVSTCIGECPFGLLFPFPSDIAGTMTHVDGVVATANRTDNNTIGDDVATGSFEANYGATLRTFARAESNALFLRSTLR